MSKLRPSFAESLESLILAHKLGPARDLIFANASESIRVNADGPDDYSQAGRSRFGGDPDLPADFRWPRGERPDGWTGYSNFVFQLNFAELPKINAQLPERGLLSVFVNFMECAADPVGLDSFFFEGDLSQLKRRESPGEEEMLDEYLIDLNPTRVSFSPGFSCEAHERDLIAAIQAACPEAAKGEEPPDNRYFDLCQNVPSGGTIGQIWGHATTYDEQTNLRREAVLGAMNKRRRVYADYWRSIEDYEATLVQWKDYPDMIERYVEMRPEVDWLLENRDMIQERVDELQLLVRVDSNAEMGLSIMDADPLYVFVKRADLADRRLDRMLGEVTQG